MSLKLVIKNKQGNFKVSLKRETTNKDLMDLCQIANSLFPDPKEERPVYGPHPASSLGSLGATDPQIIGLKGQTKLGEFPVSQISLGTYKEPVDGVRLKMLHMTTPITPAVRALRAATNISMLGCKEIIYGNYPCPILSIETAQSVVEEFHKLNLFVKIVPAFDNNAP